MADFPKIDLPPEMDWRQWVERWDRMQQRYLVKRDERFAVIVRTIKAVCPQPNRLLDLGCGTGTLILHLLENFPDAQVFGLDFDPTLIPLAKERLTRFVERTNIIHTDLRDSSWIKSVPDSMDAIVSTTALHWLKPAEIACLYSQLAKILQRGGIFLNADHVASDSPPIQKEWQTHREKMLTSKADPQAETWDDFWDAYSRALGIDGRQVTQRVIGGWEGGVEEGMPLAWHFDKLRENKFSSVDCFWRCDTDAIYGGILGDSKSQ